MAMTWLCFSLAVFPNNFEEIFLNTESNMQEKYNNMYLGLKVLVFVSVAVSLAVSFLLIGRTKVGLMLRQRPQLTLGFGLLSAVVYSVLLARFFYDKSIFSIGSGTAGGIFLLFLCMQGVIVFISVRELLFSWLKVKR